MKRYFNFFLAFIICTSVGGASFASNKTTVCKLDFNTLSERRSELVKRTRFKLQNNDWIDPALKNFYFTSALDAEVTRADGIEMPREDVAIIQNVAQLLVENKLAAYKKDGDRGGEPLFVIFENDLHAAQKRGHVYLSMRMEKILSQLNDGIEKISLTHFEYWLLKDLIFARAY